MICAGGCLLLKSKLNCRPDKVNTDKGNQPMSDKPESAGRKKILVIDDNEIILKTTSMKLQSAGYQVFTALDGSEGVAAVRKLNPDLVLLDITFPPDVSGMSWDGFRIMEWLHRVDETKKIPIIVISGVVEEKNKQRAMSSGAVAFFPKPVNFDEMIRVIRETLSAGAGQPPGSA
jgi:CheY-like chemotaxis protein